MWSNITPLCFLLAWNINWDSEQYHVSQWIQKKCISLGFLCLILQCINIIQRFLNQTSVWKQSLKPYLVQVMHQLLQFGRRQSRQWTWLQILRLHLKPLLWIGLSWLVGGIWDYLLDLFNLNTWKTWIGYCCWCVKILWVCYSIF